MIDIMNIHSLSEFQRNTKQFCKQLQETERPLVLTINGEAQLVVQDARSYQKLLDKLEYMESVIGLRKGIKEIEEGRGVKAHAALQALKEQYDIPD